jgi:hypothetical protein
MSEETFRIVIAAAVLLACLAFVVQAGIVVALYRITRKVQDKAADFVAHTEPLLAKMEPVLDKVGPVIDRIGPALDNVAAAALKVGPAVDRMLPVMDKAGVVVDRAGVLVHSANQITVSTNQVIQDLRPRIADVSDETLAIMRSGREQVERMGDLLHDAGDRARARLEQVDQSVEHTVAQIENVSGAVKNAVLRPVREVNGIAAGISAAVSAMVHGQRRSSVDSATQDEEMFI